jgi:hypothetical protein
MIPGLLYAGRPISLSLKPLIRTLVPYFAAAAVTCGILLTVSDFWKPGAGYIHELHPALSLALMLPAATTLYTGLVLLFHWSLQPLKNLHSFLRILILRNRNLDAGQ